jgi:hypothetical protein
MFEYYLLFMASHIFTESNESCDENKLALAGLSVSWFSKIENLVFYKLSKKLTCLKTLLVFKSLFLKYCVVPNMVVIVSNF